MIRLVKPDIRTRFRAWRHIEIPLGMFVFLLLAIVAFALIVWSQNRRKSPRLTVKQPGNLQLMIPSIVGMSEGVLESGNNIQLIQNGALFPMLLRDIGAAKQSVHLETYVWWTGDICRQVAEALAAKAKSGVEVRVLLDASGSHKMDDKLLELMRKSGCRVEKFHPIGIPTIGLINQRDHRKLVVIDGLVAYAGGHGIAEEWTGNAQDRKHWRDTAIRVEGPLVNRLQSVFSENWIETTGEIFAGEQYYPKPVASGTSTAHVAFSSPSGTISSVETLYYLAICSARKSIIIENPYFLPDPDAIDALAAAVKRGVDVRVVMPSAETNDSPIVQHASHHHFGTLLKRGIHVYEYNKTLLHAKVMIIDGVWSTVGSTNFDARSFKINDEVSVGIIDPKIAAQLTAAYQNDLKSAHEWTFEAWSDRPLWHKMLDGMMYAANEEL